MERDSPTALGPFGTDRVLDSGKIARNIGSNEELAKIVTELDPIDKRIERPRY